ncbi:MAG: hypothetical protein B1H40_04310 [Candidatus Latescibacteria bacterium 4484_181]|nr:MAG: hypothetical protein B1H40_04310 [Candidatus Latescibacteria bacterium 4484_181]RKY71790.1 MAG: hypothetical protein DRQ24_06580 [Candidatus Latescibacterota bacterium]
MSKSIVLGVLGAVVISLALWSIAGAGEVSNVATAGAQWLKIGVGARSVAMGSAGTVVAKDATGLYWNPATVAALKQKNISLCHIDWIADISYDFMAMTLPLDHASTLGFSLGVLSMGKMDVTTVDEPDGTGDTFGAGAFSAGVSYSRYLTDRFLAGMTVKYVREHIWDLHSSAVAVDVGTLYWTGFRSLRFGMSLSNFGTDLQFHGSQLDYAADVDNNIYTTDVDTEIKSTAYPLPLIMRFGLAYDLSCGPAGRVTLATDAILSSDQKEQAVGGVEYAYNDFIYARAGYKLRSDEAGLTAGIGLKVPLGLSILNIDYAWADMGRLSNAHRLSAGIRF